MDYKESGVDVQLADQFVKTLKLNQTGFGARVKIGIGEDEIVLATDGVGTKLLVAEELNKFDTIGIDLVAMCANDVICQCAYPKYFLDYYATGKLRLDKSKDIMAGITQGCQLAGCELVGGETAEMPGVYEGSNFDLAGFMVGECCGVLPSKEEMEEGDYLIALPSSGPHSNGYSLIRQLYDSYDSWLLTPTRIYTPEFKILYEWVKGLANITGGGIHGNLPRILPDHLTYKLNEFELSDEWQDLFDRSKLDRHEFESTFNCGFGMIAVIDQLSLLEVAFQILDLEIIGRLVEK